MKTVDDRPDKHKPVKHEIPSMPEGYYSGDKPNPNLRKFVEEHMREHPYDPLNDDYQVPSLLKSSKVKRSTKIFNMHTYWSKKPHDSIKNYIEHYTKKGDLILDPFCGSGGTILVSKLKGRDAIGIDISPIATFQSSVICSPPDLVEFKKSFEKIMRKLKNDYGWLYSIPSGNATKQIHFGISSMRFRCKKCLSFVSFFRCKKGENEKFCPNCGEPIKSNQTKFGYQLDEWHIYNEKGLDSVVNVDGSISEYEQDILDRIKLEFKIHTPPDYQFPEVGLTQRLGVRGIKTFYDLYTPRNLLALCVFRDECLKIQNIQLRNAMLFLLTACCLKASRMMGLNSDGIGRIQKNGLIAQLIVKDINVFDFLEIAYRGIYSGFSEIRKESDKSFKCILSTQSSNNLSYIPSNSVDYIFTDPPYGNRVQFWESNMVWEAWLNLNNNWSDQELIINDIRNLDENHWKSIFSQSMSECYRILKPGHWMTLTYNDKDTWPLLQDVMILLGFIPDGSTQAIAIETTAKSEKQWKGEEKGEDNTIRDLVVNFRKPHVGEVSNHLIISENEDIITFSQKVTTIIRDYISAHPGTTKDRIYDEIVSRMVRSGQLEAHNFEELLKTVAEPNAPEGSAGNGIRWYLKETELNIVDSAETMKEDIAAEIVANFITDYLKKHPENEGVHYSDIFEYYIYAVCDKPRRTLTDVLFDYFYKTEEGTYRLPMTDEEKKIKSEGRAKGVARRIRHYIAHLEQGVPIREQDRPNDSTLTDWLRHCRRAGMYEQGKVLYEKGGIRLDRLSENQQVAVEEDYMVCVRNLTRGSGTATKTTKRKKKSDVITI